MTKVQVYNTMTQKKEEFIPREPGKVSIYVCGVTPYADTHLGHARPTVVWDVIKRFFRMLGYETFHVTNFTDVDDKSLPGLGSVCAGDFQAVYCRIPGKHGRPGRGAADVYPKVSEHMPEIIELVEN